jgi:hypothetical protein
MAANQKAASNAAVRSLRVLEERILEKIQKLSADLVNKKRDADSHPTNYIINNSYQAAQKTLEQANKEKQRIQYALLNPMGSNAMTLLGTTMKSQNNMRRILSSSKSKVPKKNLSEYTVKDLLTYLGS